MSEKTREEMKPSGPLVPFLLILFMIFLFSLVRQFVDTSPEISFRQLEEFLESRQVEEVRISGLEGKIRLKAGAKWKGYDKFLVYFHSKDHVRLFLEKLEKLKDKGIVVDYKVKPENTWLNTLLVSLLPILILVFFLWFFLFRQTRIPGGPGNIMNFGKSRAKRADKGQIKVTFDDVAGIEEAKEEVREIVEFLKNPKKFTRLGGRIPRGVLLVGPPGTGKTLLAKAIAGEAGVPFFSISGSDFVEMFVGVGASRVRDLFQQARENAPSLIFLDEIDAVGRKRGSGLGGGHDEREQTLNAILVEMDGFDTDESVIVIAATNRPDVLDPALLRPGRFDRQVVLDLPDLEAREAILKVHAKKVKLGPDVDLKAIARSTATFSGAELAAIINEAAIMATMKDKDFVEQEDLEAARDKVRWGRSQVSRMRAMEEEDKRITSYHESGHALIALHLEGLEPLHKVTIIPQGRALGLTMLLPKKDQFHLQKQKILKHITLLYGGRVAEELFCGDISSGAQNDIEQATKLARMMVCEWGMSETLGPVKYSHPKEHIFLGTEISQPREYSEATAELIDQEVKRILDECYNRAKKIISENREDLVKLAEALLKYEQLSGEEVQVLLQGGSIEEYRQKKREEIERKKEELRQKEEEERRKKEEERRKKLEQVLSEVEGREPEPKEKEEGTF